MARRVWADLPPELIPAISDQLGIINLLSFRGVCKSWNLASITSSAEIESSPDCKPWFLVYGETSQCVLLSGHGKKYDISIPELNGATCIASKEGWLLLYREGGSIYFFCPFSRAKIDLPLLPSPEVNDCVATFSSAPTSNDCIVTVGCQNDEMEIELYMLSRGADAWTKQEYTHSRGKIYKIRAAAYADKTFQFYDDLDGLLAFSPGEDEKWVKYNLVPPTKEREPGMKTLPFALERNSLRKKGMMKNLGLEEDSLITCCGTVVAYGEGQLLYFNEGISESQESESKYCSKGVWLTPRFYQISPELRW